ncbi:MAG: EAL domain-containing protein [Lachnospiraceae bacterium]|nr:EAL domain-containing protein [Lachnospiraceae bacterium]
MSKAKDKRIKKFNKKRIWPSIVGLFFISVFAVGIVVGILALYVINLVDEKLYDAYKLSLKVAEYVTSEDLKELSSEDLKAHLSVVDTINAVTVLDENNDILWSNNEYTINLDKLLLYNDENSFNIDNYNIIIHSDSLGLFDVINDETELSDDILDKFMNKDVFLHISDFRSRNIPVIYAEIWIGVEVNGYNIFVLNDLNIYNHDLRMVLITFELILVLTIIFMIYYVSSIVSVARSQKKITKVLYTDMVTGGNNWLYFTKKGDKLLRKNRGRLNYAVVNLRMEKYRSFCTCFGVVEGEELMEKFYNALKKQFNNKELISHHDEADFGLLIAYKSEEDLIHRIEKIEQILWSQVPNVKLYFKFGVCIADNNDREIDSLYNNATTALEMLPEDSDEKIASYDIEMKKQQLWERRIEDEMDKALVTKQFKLYLQPKYSAKEEKLAGAEALVRWIHPVDGLIPPNKFIPIFESNGFILQLDDYMLEEVAAQQSKWSAEGRELFPISVNVSRAHFTREDLAEHICKIVDKYNVPHQYIELELTESAFFDDKYVLIDTVNQLRQYGFVVSMDDFGAGYSSLNSLKELTIDVLKIDADFFRGIESVDRGMLIVSEVIDLAKKLNMKIVAEGIENKEQVEFLTEQECDLIQGYYFAKPMSIEEFEEKYS